MLLPLHHSTLHLVARPHLLRTIIRLTPNPKPCASPANIDELSGSVCLDVINQTWSPMFDMVNIFEVFMPQLLRYPNAADPLNGEAAALLMRDPKAYDNKVKGKRITPSTQWSWFFRAMPGAGQVS